MIQRVIYPLDRHGYDAGPSTPWGKAQGGYHIWRGVVCYYTAGHGGFRVSRKIAEKYMTEYSRLHCTRFDGRAYWYEEDCEVNLPLYELSKNLPGFKEKALEFSSHATIENLEERIGFWFKDYPKEAA